MTLKTNKIISFQQFIFSWWEKNKRDLPWRRTNDPYRILVSEVMLQQTQVSRVLPKYQEFLERFPTIYSLAGANLSQVLKVWKGMGYNRRALYLKRAAEKVITDHQGIFPKAEKTLTELPGLGKYTARAILVFAYKMDTAMIDTNIRQIITHFFLSGAKQKEKTIQEIADQLVPKGRSWEWHQALMDFGAMALPKYVKKKSQSEKSAARKAPFKGSNRFYRGRIIDLLREDEKVEEELIKLLKATYKKDQDYFDTIIEGLLKDGLIKRDEKMIKLAD